MHVENELVEFVTAGDQEYEEEILIPEEIPESSLTDFTDTPPAQGKPRCIYIYIYIYI
jgi:hypothetical protein